MKTVKTILSLSCMLSLLALTSSASFSEDVPDISAPPANTAATEKKSLTDQLTEIDQKAGTAGWKVRNGCLQANRIKRIKFVDDKTALVTM